MWISKKKYQQLEKKIADLEVQVQGQQSEQPTSAPEWMCNKPNAYGVAKICWETEGVKLDLDKPIRAIVTYDLGMSGLSAEIYQT